MAWIVHDGDLNHISWNGNYDTSVPSVGTGPQLSKCLANKLGNYTCGSTCVPDVEQSRCTGGPWIPYTLSAPHSALGWLVIAREMGHWQTWSRFREVWGNQQTLQKCVALPIQRGAAGKLCTVAKTALTAFLHSQPLIWFSKFVLVCIQLYLLANLFLIILIVKIKIILTSK